jgi:hypothetical protein
MAGDLISRHNTTHPSQLIIYTTTSAIQSAVPQAVQKSEIISSESSCCALDLGLFHQPREEMTRQQQSCTLEDDGESRQSSIRSFFTAKTPQHAPKRTAQRPENKKGNNKKSKRSSEQLYLDFGQRDFGHRTLCSTCGMLYVDGVQEDAQQHAKICKDYVKGVPFAVSLPGRAIPITGDPASSIVEVRIA